MHLQLKQLKTLKKQYKEPRIYTDSFLISLLGLLLTIPEKKVSENPEILKNPN